MKTQAETPDPRLEAALNAVVALSTRVPEEAMTASLLGTERSGHGVVIGADGLIVTIGYLIAEAESVWITTRDGRNVPGFALGYDTESGFGLVRAAHPLNIAPVPFGRAADLQLRDAVVVGESDGELTHARIAAKQEFAGRWEYLLDEAIYTVPAVTDWAGAGLFDTNGKLCGIGSLLVHDGSSERAKAAANMFVPIDILLPHLEDLVKTGRRKSPPRPWLGLLIHDAEDQLLIAGVYRHCPGDEAGLKPGDVITELAGKPVSDLADFFRRTWALGPAGTSIPLTILRDGETLQISVKSAERASFFRKGTIN
jgi:S1-C subfamily serine protease